MQIFFITVLSLIVVLLLALYGLLASQLKHIHQHLQELSEATGYMAWAQGAGNQRVWQQYVSQTSPETHTATGGEHESR